MTTNPRYRADALVAFAHELLARAGVRDDIARDVATVLVDGDLLGHTTHGLALLGPYLAEIDKGTMAKAGEPRVINARPAAQTWDGGRLPGPWVTLRAFDAAAAMALAYGTGTVVVRRSHHIACLASYLKRMTDRKLMALLTCSDPAMKSVAPFGAVSSVFTPNPLAAGIPTSGDPILLDISASYTTNGLTGRLHNAGERLPHAWIQDAQGNPTRDPAVLFNEPKGTLLPLGGLEAGHKGYALALLVEAATGALAGHGRADPNEGWGATVFVQVLDPEASAARRTSRARSTGLRKRVATRPPTRRTRRAHARGAWVEKVPRPAARRRRAVRRHHAVACAVGGEAWRGHAAGGAMKEVLALALLARAPRRGRPTGSSKCPRSFATSQALTGVPGGWSGVARTASADARCKARRHHRGHAAGRDQRVRRPAFEMADLVPDDPNARIVQWTFAKNRTRDIYVVCNYADTRIALSRKAPPTVTSCALPWPRRASSASSPSPAYPARGRLPGAYAKRPAATRAMPARSRRAVTSAKPAPRNSACTASD